MNPRPPGYEPDELPTALLRDMRHIGFPQCSYRIPQNERKVKRFFVVFMGIFCLLLSTGWSGVGMCFRGAVNGGATEAVWRDKK